MNLKQLASLGLLLCSGQLLAVSVNIATGDMEKVKELRKTLIEAGIDSKLMSARAYDDSIIVAMPDKLDEKVGEANAQKYPKGWLILLDESKASKQDQLIQKLHDGLPESRVTVSNDTKDLAARIKLILKEQRRLKAGIAGLNTVDDPEKGKTFNDGRDEVPLAPLGSAIITRSGKLYESGIRSIIHTGSGSMSRKGKGYEPSVESVRNSLINALALARENGHDRIAVPLIGGSIFRGRMNNGKGITLAELINQITDVLVRESAGMKIVLTVRADNPTESNLVKKSLAKLSQRDQARFEVSDKVQWSIVKFDAHKASAIVNSANMEFLFGTGISGIIAAAADGIAPEDVVFEEKDDEKEDENKKQRRHDRPSDKIDEDAHEKIMIFKRERN